MNKLTKITTKELVNELGKRKEVQVFQDRLYQAGYNINITHKYSEDRTPIELPANKTVVVIEESPLNVEDKTDGDTEVIWRRFELIDKGKEDKLLKLAEERGLSREDLMLILKTIKIREFKDDEAITRIDFEEFLSSIFTPKQIIVLKKVLKEHTKAVYFHGSGIGKSTLSNLLRTLGYNASEHCENYEKEKEFLSNRKKCVSFHMDKERPVALIPNMYEQLLGQRRTIIEWIIS